MGKRSQRWGSQVLSRARTKTVNAGKIDARICLSTRSAGLADCCKVRTLAFCLLPWEVWTWLARFALPAASFSCPKARPHRGKLLCKKLGRQLSPEEVLGTPEGVKVIADWSPQWSYLGEIEIGGHQRKVRLGESTQNRAEFACFFVFY